MKHFLDTSVARSMLLGSSTYREYFRNEFGDGPLYLTCFIQMEFRRSYLRNVIDFYFTLDLPTIRTFDDAIQLWSNKFQGSKIKAVLQLVKELIRTRHLDTTNPKDKASAQQAIGQYVTRMDTKLRRKFVNTGTDSPRCARAAISLQATQRDAREELDRFAREFDNVERCRSLCRIDRFFTLVKNRTHTEGFIKQAQSAPRVAEARGFISIADCLRETLEKGADAYSCKMCEKIGDAVIALDAPRTMQLDHVDRSFNHLCPPIGQPHKEHPSETALLTSSK